VKHVGWLICEDQRVKSKSVHQFAALAPSWRQKVPVLQLGVEKAPVARFQYEPVEPSGCANVPVLFQKLWVQLPPPPLVLIESDKAPE
jgi:hypothetical protein